MHMPSVKKILLLGFVIVLLVAIPLTIYFVSEQQKAKTSSIPSTTLSFTPTSQSINLGSDANFDINIDPGSNSVSFVKVLISYDATKFATDGAGFVNSGSFPSLIQGPTYELGTISITLSIGANAPPINKPAKLGTLTFKTIAPTDTAPTQITFGNQTQVLAVGTAGQFNENVLSTTTPATVNINGAVALPTPTQTLIPTPTIQSNESATPSSNEVSLATPASTAEAPICSSFTADRALTGIAPYNVNFTLIGTSSATAVKATFNFGDGQVTDLTQADGIGQTSVNALTSHIYNSAGSFSAFGTITDVNGAISQVGTCTAILTINPSSTTTAQITPLPGPLPPIGLNNIVIIGIIGVLLVVIVAVLLLVL